MYNLPPNALGSIDEMPFLSKWKNLTSPAEKSKDFVLIEVMAFRSNVRRLSLVNDEVTSGILVNLLSLKSKFSKDFLEDSARILRILAVNTSSKSLLLKSRIRKRGSATLGSSAIFSNPDENVIDTVDNL